MAPVYQQIQPTTMAPPTISPPPTVNQPIHVNEYVPGSKGTMVVAPPSPVTYQHEQSSEYVPNTKGTMVVAPTAPSQFTEIYGQHTNQVHPTGIGPLDERLCEKNYDLRLG